MARSGERRSSSQRQSWRYGAQHSAASGSKSGQRVAMTVVVLGLLALCGLALYHLWPSRRVPFLGSISIDYHPLVAPRLPFAGENQRAIQESSQFQINPAPELSTAYQLSNLSGVPLLQTGAKDHFFLYLQTHAFSHEGKATLACSDFFHQSLALTGETSQETVNDGMADASKFLTSVADAPAAMKVLFLDTGYIQQDVRWGLVANEFPKLLAEEMAALPPTDFWVVQAHDVFQRSTIDHGRRKTVFNQSLTEALSGAADQEPWGDGDRYVSLDELYKYVLRRCSQWIDKDNGQPQTPVLLKAGQGQVKLEALKQRVAQDVVKYRLVIVTPPAEPADGEPASDEQASAEAAGKAAQVVATAPRAPRLSPAAPRTLLASQTRAGSADPPPPPAGGTANGESAATPSAGTASAATANATQNPPAAPTPAPSAGPATAAETPSTRETPKLSPRQACQARLVAAWEIRDKLVGRQTPGGWSPIDFAPHLWREAEAWLLFYEQQMWSIHDQPNDALLKDIEEATSDLMLLAGSMREQSPSNVSSQVKRLTTRYLIEAWLRFSREARPSYEQAERHPALRAIRDAEREYRDALYESRYAISWHARESQTSTNKSPSYDTIELLLKTLGQQRAQLNQLAASQIDPTTANLSSLSDRTRQIKESRAAIYRGMRSPSNNFQIANKPIQRRLMDDSLATPLLRAADRDQLLTSLLETAVPTPELRDVGALPEGNLTPTPLQWNQVHRRLMLEAKLIEVIDSQWAERLSIPTISATNWQLYHEAGAKLRDYYLRLPTSIKKSPQDTSQVLDALLLVDPRDVKRVSKSAPLSPFRYQLLVRDEVWLVSSQALYQARFSPASPLIIDVFGSKRELLAAPRLATVDFDSELLRVTQNLGPIATLPDGSYSRPLELQIVALKDRKQAAKRLTRLSVNLVDRGHAKGGPEPIDIELPLPDMVDLQLVRGDGFGSFFKEDQAIISGGLIPLEDELFRLRPFPNRQTKYQLSLINRSGSPKSVEVLVYGIPPRPDKNLPPGLIATQTIQELYNRQRKEVASDAVLVGKTAAINLPADLAPTKIQLQPPTTPAAEAKPAAAATPAAEASQPPPKAAAIDVRQGLLFVIRDVNRPETSWAKWIEIRPLEPKEYFDFHMGYDVRGQRLAAVLTPKDLNGDGQPDLPPGAAVDVKWEYGGRAVPQGRPQARFQREAGKALTPQLLYLDRTPRPNERVRITVDGYPRAFIYRRPEDIPREQRVPGMPSLEIQPWQDASGEASIAIAKLQVVGGKEIFHFTDRTVIPEKPEEGFVHQALASSQPAVIKITNELIDPDILVELQVDVGSPGLESKTREDQVFLNFEGRSYKHYLYSQRQLDLKVLPFDEAGLLTIETGVGDFQIRMDTGGLSDQRARLLAHLQCPDLGTADDQVNVVFDASRPIIRSLRTATKSIVQGRDLQMTAEVDEISGIQNVEVGLDADGDGKLAEAEVLKINPQWAPRGNGPQWTILFRIPGKQLAPGEHELLMRVTDLVGRQSDYRAEKFNVAKQVGIIRGMLTMAGRKPVANPETMRVFLEGPTIGKVRLKLDANFGFFQKDVADGKYTITAEGTVFNSYKAVGKRDMVEPWPSDSKHEPIEIILMRPPVQRK